MLIDAFWRRTVPHPHSLTGPRSLGMYRLGRAVDIDSILTSGYLELILLKRQGRSDVRVPLVVASARSTAPWCVTCDRLGVRDILCFGTVVWTRRHWPKTKSLSRCPPSRRAGASPLSRARTNPHRTPRGDRGRVVRAKSARVSSISRLGPSSSAPTQLATAYGLWDLPRFIGYVCVSTPPSWAKQLLRRRCVGRPLTARFSLRLRVPSALHRAGRTTGRLHRARDLGRGRDAHPHPRRRPGVWFFGLPQEVVSAAGQPEPPRIDVEHARR